MSQDEPVRTPASGSGADKVRTMSDERRHAEEVARQWCSAHSNPNWSRHHAPSLADLLMAERADLLARAEAAEFRVADLKFALGDGAGWFDRFTAERNARERAEAAAGQMRVALEVCKNLTRHQEWAKGEIGEIGRMVGACVDAALTDAGRGYLSPEQVAQACAAARDAALEEAADAIRDSLWPTTVGGEYARKCANIVTALKVTP